MSKLNWINKINAPLKVFIFLAVLVFIPIIVSAATLTAGTTGGWASPINSTGTLDLWDASCKKIISTSAIPYFIPTKSSPEWTAFTSYKPATITILECATICGPGYYVIGTTCNACGSANLYKRYTDSSTSCSTVDSGYYSIGGTDATNRWDESYCPAGYYCSAGVAYNCGCGYYCTGGIAHVPCGANQYYAGVNGTGSGVCSNCTSGNISSAGSCAAGDCSALSCSAGYYVNGYVCSACGGDAYYCTGGVMYAVSAGYYSTGTAGARSGQSQCGANTYCSGGASYACSGGTPYSNAGATGCVACLSSPQCGTNAWEGATSCSGGNVYQNYRTYTCSGNACSSSAPSTLRSYCSYCVSGSCVDCTAASQCGTNGWEGATSCSSGNVYQNYRTYTCNSYTCGSSASSTLKSTCSYCAGGACVACTAASNCGTNGWEGATSCSGSNVYQNYRTYTCSGNACGSSAPSTLKSACSYCVSGSCVACTAASNCGTNGWEGATSCSGNTVVQNYRTYTCNSYTCGSSAPSTSKTVCSGGTPYCAGGACVACTAASQCGTNGWEGATSCSSGNVYQNYRTYTCNSNTCGSSAPSTLKTSCSGGTPYCVSGSCVECNYSWDCGTTGLTGSPFCAGSAPAYVGQLYATYSCTSGSCGATFPTYTLETCSTAGTCQTGGGCSNATCTSVSNAAAGTKGTGCNSLHYVCNGYGSCTAPTTTYTHSYSGGAGCPADFCPNSTLVVSCSARVTCWESPNYVFYNINYGSSYSCNSAYMSCYATLYDITT